MSEQTSEFSTQKISPQLVSKIVDILKNKAYGSVEIYIENYNVVQISERTITKFTKPKPSKRFTISVRRSTGFGNQTQRVE